MHILAESSFGQYNISSLLLQFFNFPYFFQFYVNPTPLYPGGPDH